MSSRIDTTTRRWIRDAADERAATNGCWFDEQQGQFVVDWMYTYLRLYEGENAGDPLECKDWQYEAVMRLFGWQRNSTRWGRPIRRFTKASWWVPKKNKKSPTLAAIALYTFCGDNEMGQKVFLCAKDGTQAREIAGRHAVEMCLRSEQLMSECTINRSKMQITHEPTRSILVPLSSDDERAQKAKEGLNGSVFVDEVHVVDGAFMSRISRAGISRSEPIQLEVSTAGNEPESYGKAQFDYGQAVADGRKEDQSLLFIAYAAPQDLSDADLLADPIKFGKQANPAWGHTVGEEEFLDDLNRSKVSLARLAEFKMYRLNVWQQSSSPWIRVHDWQQCLSSSGEDGELPDDVPTFGGLDLSRTTDFTAWMKFQPADADLDRRPRCSGHYWIPEERARTLQEQLELPILEWVHQGWITLSGERRIDYNDVIRHLNDDVARYRLLRYVGYDPYNADVVVRNLSEEHGVEMIEMRQGVATLSAPAKELERLAIAHELDHRGDPVLAWMIGNTSIRLDENGNIKPVKTVGGVRKHIDGVIALVMAILASQLNPDGGSSVYESRGIMTL
jgi:phage terminase large subunit-like protein